MTINRRGLQRFVSELNGVLDAAVALTANQVADLERQLVPVDKGDLQSTIRVEDGPAPFQRRVIAGDAAAGIDYAPYVEYGTDNPNYPAQPFVTPSAEAVSLEQNVRDGLRRLAARSGR